MQVGKLLKDWNGGRRIRRREEDVLNIKKIKIKAMEISLIINWTKKKITFKF